MKRSSPDLRGERALTEATLPSQPPLSRMMAMMANHSSLARVWETLEILAGRSPLAVSRA